MRASWRRAERDAAVRDAARAWKRAGLVDEGALATVEADHPDDRRRLGPVFRSLVFAFTVFAAGALFTLAELLLENLHAEAFGVLALLLGAALCVLTELLKSPLRLADSGAEAATGLMAVLFLLVGWAWLLDDVLKLHGSSLPVPFFTLGALLFAAAAVRWGSAVGAALAAVFFWLLLAQCDGARLLWLVTALVIAPVALRAGDSPRLCPSHRRACVVIAGLALAALYLSLHLGSWDEQLIEHGLRLTPHSEYTSLPLPRPAFVLGTALLPLFVLAHALGARRRLTLDLGVLMLVASLVTLRTYVHLAALWVVLSASGAALVLSVLALRRWLDSGTGAERRGFTARPLLAETTRTQVAEAAIAIAMATPKAAPPRTSTGFEGGGGRSGGAGATGEF